MMKKKVVMDNSNMAEKLAHIRDELSAINGDELDLWVKSLPDIKDSNGNNEVQKLTFYNVEHLPDEMKTLETLPSGIFLMENLPPVVKEFIDSMFDQTKLTYDIVRYFEVNVIKPYIGKPKKVNGNFHVNKFDFGKLNVSDRFVYIFGLENLTYEIIDISQMASEFGLSAKNMIDTIPDFTSKSKAYRLNLQSSMGVNITYDDNLFYTPPKRNGFRDIQRKKTSGRWGMVIDLYSIKERLDDVVDEKLKPVSDLIEGKSNSKKAKLLRKFNDSVKKNEEKLLIEDEERKKLLSELDESDDTIPNLVELDDSKKSDQNNYDEDVEQEILDAL